jgi:hypothetical protein
VKVTKKINTNVLRKYHLTRRSNIVPLRSTGQNLSSFFVVLLRKIFPQKSYLNSAVYRNVRPKEEAMINKEVNAEILRRLESAEIEHDVKIILAVESGSRAWGFESTNSDYDARFIYVHRPEWYHSVGLEEKRDVIEYPIVDDLDINGWDLRKALRLYWKSNPAFVE